MATKLFTKKCCLCVSTVKHLRLLRPTISRYFQTNNGEDQQTADIVISGGGMVGASMACALGRTLRSNNVKIIRLVRCQ